jgi:SAM-dependent methyltransferase
MKIDYKLTVSDLCGIGKKYDTDKSSQRENVSITRHCHPYTLFYDSLFREYKDTKLEVAEIGILEGASIRMWREYFQNSHITGFEYDMNLINNFKDTERVTLAYMDVKNKSSIIASLKNQNKVYDIIIEDSTHYFEDQIRVIENAHQYLKDGGVLIIEDIFRSYDENDYYNALAPILDNFQDFYFVDLEHVNRVSTGWNNDKLFILVKKGAEPIFKNKNKMTIITPSYRTTNLQKIKDSIDFDYVDEWIIVYDGRKIGECPNLFADNTKVKEYVYTGDGISGNQQRNFGLSKITNKDTYLYYLDDDNIIYKPFYKLLDIIDKGKMYTFNQKNRIKGHTINVGSIDTAMCLIHASLCEGIQWIPNKYDADGYYIKACYDKNIDKHIYVDEDMSLYNALN